MTAIALTEPEMELVRAILNAHLPDNVSVAVFGSRAGGRVKPFSDVDLVFEGPERLPSGLLSLLADAFDESLLRYKVDLVDRHAVSEEFGAIVDATKVPFSR